MKAAMPSTRCRSRPGSFAVTAAYIGLGVSTLSWSLVPVFQKQLLEVFNPVEITFLRFSASGFLLLGVLLASQPRELWRVVRKDPRDILLTSILGPLLATLALNFGIQTVAVAVAAIIVAIEPMLTYLIAVSLGREPWSMSRALRILVCFAGVTIIVADDARYDDVYWLGLLAVCLTPIIWAVNTVISKGLVTGSSPIAVVTVNFLISSACLVPFVGTAWFGKLVGTGMYHWSALAFCVVLGTAISYCIWYASLQFVSPSTLSVSLYAIPIFTIAGAVTMLGERLSVVKSLGIIIVLFGLYIMNVRYKDAS
jgi:drug/metabolite transporter (DMT)-like permease